MRKSLVPLTVGLIFGSAVWVVKATPLSGLPPATSQNHSLLETIGCTRSGDNCPYGFAIKRHGGGSWSCVPCDNQKYGSRYRDDHDEYYEPRRYRDYGDGVLRSQTLSRLRRRQLRAEAVPQLLIVRLRGKPPARDLAEAAARPSPYPRDGLFLKEHGEKGHV